MSTGLMGDFHMGEVVTSVPYRGHQPPQEGSVVYIVSAIIRPRFLAKNIVTVAASTARTPSACPCVVYLGCFFGFVCMN